jgi:hypothetical protein
MDFAGAIWTEREREKLPKKQQSRCFVVGRIHAGFVVSRTHTHTHRRRECERERDSLALPGECCCSATRNSVAEQHGLRRSARERRISTHREFSFLHSQLSGSRSVARKVHGGRKITFTARPLADGDDILMKIPAMGTQRHSLKIECARL